MITEESYIDYLSKLLKGDRVGCREYVNKFIKEGINVRELYLNLFQRSLYDVGTLWETNKISVAIEHLCTSITESLITLSYPLIFSAEHTGKKAVITCTPGEFHQIGARMVADYFEMYGWDGYFIGAETPESDLIKFIEEKNPDVLAISMSVYFHLAELTELVIKLNHNFPNLEILLGGQGFRWGGDKMFRAIKNVHIIHSLNDLEKRLMQNGL